ncbi:MAG: hypothetical protein RL638_2430 [Bacteroidota bacterium]
MEMNTPWVESPFFNDLLLSKGLSSADQKIAEDYHRDGFVVLPGHFDHHVIDNLVRDLHERGFESTDKKVIRDENRIQDFWIHSDYAKRIASDDRIHQVLQMLYEREPIPFQTLHFKKGSTQMAHSDAIHFSSFPEKYMCGVWVALEDVDENNGPLYYYPGSHKLPEYNFSHIRRSLSDTTWNNYHEYELFIEKLMLTLKFEKFIFKAKKGDVLIWSSNIIHGGEKIVDPNRTRLSQVNHFFFSDCIYYAPMISNVITGEYAIKQDFLNIRTNQKVRQTYNGEMVQFARLRDRKYAILNYFSPYSSVISKLNILFHQFEKFKKRF